jgi:competence protein ComEC
VLEVGEGAGRALLLADVDSTVEESLRIAPGVAALKVAHHGSASSSGMALLSRIGPCLALVSVGSRNPFGHPAEATLARLEAAGCRIERTDRSGALWLELSPAGVRLLDWKRAAPHPTAAGQAPPDPRPRE